LRLPAFTGCRITDRVIGQWAAALRPEVRSRSKVPANSAQPSHVVAREVAGVSRTCRCSARTARQLDPVREYVLEPEEYAQILYDLGFERQLVRLQVYPHVLPSSRHVVEWVRGTTLTRFEKRLDPVAFASFVDDYEREVVGCARRARAVLLPVPPHSHVGPSSRMTA
jgi:trans-aconitate 2-methyltransferase